jgi:hypothetical protein
MTLIDAMANTNLPDAAYHPSSDKFKQSRVDQNGSPNSVSALEQYLRVAIAVAGKHWTGLELAQKAVEYQREYEKEHVFSDFTVDRSRISESDDVWLSHELDGLCDRMQEIYNEEKRVYARRMDWYNDTVMSDLRDKINRVSKMADVMFMGIRVVNDDVENTENTEHGYYQKSLAGTPITKFGYNKPVDVIACVSPDSGNLYPFVPWYGTTVCTCPYKHEYPVSTLCKHELAALVQYSRDKYDPGGVSVPERFKRLMNAKAYNTFKNEIM